MTEHENANSKLIVDVLLKEYDQRRSEIISQKQRYDRQEQILTAYVSLATTLTLGILTGSVSAAGFTAKLSNVNPAVCVTVLSIGVCVAFYFISNLMESLYLLHAHSARAADIERQINRRVEHGLLAWDSEIAPLIFSTSFQFAPPFIGPNVLVAIWSPSIFIGLIGLFSYVCYVFASQWFWPWGAIVWFLTGYHIFDWYLLATIQRNRLDSTMQNFGDKPEDSSKRIAGQALLVFIATLWLGFIPFAVLSLMTHTFLPTSRVSVPLTLVPSVLIGDSILLPLFNRSVWVLVAPNFRSLTKHTRTALLIGGLLSLTISAPIVIYEHILWTRDQYTGFIKLSLGHLSLAGIWHAAFASIEMALLSWFLGISLIWSRDRQRLPRRQLLQTWGIFLVYASLCVPDYIIKRIHLSPQGLPLSDLLALSPIALASGVYLLLRRLSSAQITSGHVAVISSNWHSE